MEFLIWLAVLPAIVIGILIYRADELEHEPVIELIKALLLGVLAVGLTLFLSYLFHVTDILEDFDNLLQVGLYSFLGISLIEEFSKWICAYLFLIKNKNYNYLFDGIVYTSFVALGFATVENILYTISGGITTGIIRAVTTVPAHAFFGIISGYHLSLAKKEKVESNEHFKLHLFYSLLIPIILHGFYDFCLLTQNFVFLMIYLVFVVVLYAISIYHTKKLQSLDGPFARKTVLFCSNCGKKIIGKYCSNCGKKVEEDS